MRCLLGSVSGDSDVQVFHLTTGGVFFSGLTKVNWERESCLIGGGVDLLLGVGGREGLSSWLKERSVLNLSSESLTEQI